MTGEVGEIYLLHFDRPLQHARHYRGWARNLAGRLAHHAKGSGARLTQVAVDRGIGWVLADVRPGTRAEERRLKNLGSAERTCPVCQHLRAMERAFTWLEQAKGCDRTDEESKAFAHSWAHARGVSLRSHWARWDGDAGPADFARLLPLIVHLERVNVR